MIFHKRSNKDQSKQVISILLNLLKNKGNEMLEN